MSIKDHARFKLLFGLDGISLSFRLHKIMRTGSPVLKESSPWVEYFSRSLRNMTHYIPVWNYPTLWNGVLDTVQEYLDPKNDRLLRNIAQNAQEFAWKYTGSRARALYWQRTLTEYKSLWEDMDAWIEEVCDGELAPLGAACSACLCCTCHMVCTSACACLCMYYVCGGDGRRSPK